MSDYQSCMTSAMKGFPHGISREERGRLFCIEAKVCSGKIANREEAGKYCDEHPPEPRAARKARRAKRSSPNCGQDMASLAGCAITKLDLSQVGKQSFVEDMALALAMALQECGCKNGG
jgi:hypothetical protein